MIPELGHFALILALLVAVVQGVFPLWGTLNRNAAWESLARPSALMQAALVALAFACLSSSFLSNDFSVVYVAQHSNTLLPKPYQLAAVWGGHEGSLLLWVLMLALPCAIALAVFGVPLVSALFHYGAFGARDVAMTAHALLGYGVGLLGLIAIKVLAPAYFADMDTRTPVRIAIMVLITTQLLNVVLVPIWAHAGLALSISLGAWLNAAWLLYGLRRKGAYRPRPGWWGFVLRVVFASLLLGAGLFWAAQSWDWVAGQAQPLQRILWLFGVLIGSGVVYLGALIVSGLELRAMWRR